MSDLEQRLCNCFAAVFPDIASEQIPSVTAKSLEAWDSLATMNLVSVIEEEFDIEVSSDAAPQFVSVAGILEHVRAQSEISDC